MIILIEPVLNPKTQTKFDKKLGWCQGKNNKFYDKFVDFSKSNLQVCRKCFEVITRGSTMKFRQLSIQIKHLITFLSKILFFRRMFGVISIFFILYLHEYYTFEWIQWLIHFFSVSSITKQLININTNTSF